MSAEDPTFPRGVLDLRPAIQRKRSSECAHDYVEIDDTLPSLSCADCGAELDPWWYLRKRAAAAADERNEWAEAARRFDGWIASTSATIARQHAEIARLTELKNRLWNESINGAPLGSQVKRPRRRRTS